MHWRSVVIGFLCATWLAPAAAAGSPVEKSDTLPWDPVAPAYPVSTFDTYEIDVNDGETLTATLDWTDEDQFLTLEVHAPCPSEFFPLCIAHDLSTCEGETSPLTGESPKTMSVEVPADGVARVSAAGDLIRPETTASYTLEISVTDDNGEEHASDRSVTQIHDDGRVVDLTPHCRLLGTVVSI